MAELSWSNVIEAVLVGLFCASAVVVASWGLIALVDWLIEGA
jgi:hypothetical protein